MLRRRIGSLLLCGSLLWGMTTVTAWAEPISRQEEEPIPDTIAELMEEKDFSAVSEDLEESLNHVVFEKEDGKRVLYMYDTPVKYRDDAGEIRFKTGKAAKTGKKNGKGKKVYAYENPENDLRVYLPRHIKDGVLTEKNDYKLEVFPEIAKNSKIKKVGQEEDAPILEYKDALGEDTHLQYVYTLDGCKENIILDRYTGQNEFRFALDTHGLVPRETEGHIIVLEDPATGEGIFVFDQLDAEDVDFSETLHYEDVSYNNYYRIEPDMTEGEDSSRYILTAIIDPVFLAAETTQYPVTIDPPIHWCYNTGDTSVFAGSTACYNDASTDYVGYHPQLGQAYKLAWCDTGVLKFINVNNVTKAQYYARITGAPAGWNMILAVPSRNWTTDTVKYSDVNNNYRTLQTISMTNSSEIGKYFDITGEFKEWLKADLGEAAAYDSHRGIMFMPGSNCPTNSYRLFYSANAPSSQMPAVVVEYTVDTSLAEGTYFIQNYACDRYLDVYYAGTASGTGTNICNFNGNNNQRWIVQRVSPGSSTNDYYYIRPAHAPHMYLYARDEYACRLTISNERMVWRIVGNSDGSYRIMPGDTERQAAESASGNIADGTIVQTWGFGNAPNQKWVFRPLNSITGMKNNKATGTFLWMVLVEEVGPPVPITKIWTQNVRAEYRYIPSQYKYAITKVNCFFEYDRAIDPNLGSSLEAKNANIGVNGTTYYSLVQDNNVLVDPNWLWDNDYIWLNMVVPNGCTITACSQAMCSSTINPYREANQSWNLYF